MSRIPSLASQRSFARLIRRIQELAQRRSAGKRVGLSSGAVSPPVGRRRSKGIRVRLGDGMPKASLSLAGPVCLSRCVAGRA